MPRQVYLVWDPIWGIERFSAPRAREPGAGGKPAARFAVYETPPWGYNDQPAFLNQVVEVQTELEPEDLLAKLKGIENNLGRVKNFRYGPRCIDIDILFYGDRVYQSDALTIPHPFLAERAFVLVPLNDVAPDFIHPILKISVSELLAALNDHEVKPYRAEEA